MANLLHVDKAYNLRVNNFPCKKEKKCPGLDKHLKLFKQSFQVAFELLRSIKNIHGGTRGSNAQGLGLQRQVT